MDSTPVYRFSLCENCEHCPEVQVYPDHIVIGEKPEVAVLSIDQWAVLLRAVKEGKFDRSDERPFCPCTPECCCCGSCPPGM